MSSRPRHPVVKHQTRMRACSADAREELNTGYERWNPGASLICGSRIPDRIQADVLDLQQIWYHGNRVGRMRLAVG